MEGSRNLPSNTFHLTKMPTLHARGGLLALSATFEAISENDDQIPANSEKPEQLPETQLLRIPWCWSMWQERIGIMTPTHSAQFTAP